MKNFREAYRETINGIPVPDFCTEEISEEDQKSRALPYRRKRYMAAAALAGGIFVIYTLGGVAVTNYTRSLVRADENGFQTMDMETVLLTQEDRISQITAEESGEEMNAGGTAVAYMEDGGAADLAKIEEYSDGIVSERMSRDADYEQQYTSLEEFEEEDDIPLELLINWRTHWMEKKFMRLRPLGIMK